MKTFISSLLIAVLFLTYSCKKSSPAPKRVSVQYAGVYKDSVQVTNPANDAIGSVLVVYNGEVKNLDINAGDSISVGSNFYLIVSSSEQIHSITSTTVEVIYAVQINTMLPSQMIYDEDVYFYHNNIE